ncbi:MAG: rhomboid family intramembrane serine protease [Parvibaculum sp.]
MIPLSDENPVGRVPFVTWGLIATCVTVFLWQISLSDKAVTGLFLAYGVVPAQLFDQSVQRTSFVPPEWTLVSSQFLHGGFGHLAGNMLFLYIFGDNIEAAMGRLKFLVFYLLSGIAAAVGHGMMAPLSTVPMIGASGAISGVLGAYLLLYPHARVRVLFLPLPIPIFRVVLIPAVMVLGIWFLIQFVSAAVSSPEGGGVAFGAHVAGFVAGMALLPFFKARGVAYWQPARPRVFDARGGGLPDHPYEKGPDSEGSGPDKSGPVRRGPSLKRGPWGKRGS